MSAGSRWWSSWCLLCLWPVLAGGAPAPAAGKVTESMSISSQSRAQVLALVDRLVALRGADTGEIGGVLGVSLRARTPQFQGNHDAEATFAPGHPLKRAELSRDAAQPGRQGWMDLELGDAVCLRRADLDQHFASEPVPHPVSPPPLTPGEPDSPRPVRPGDWVSWSYELDWGTVVVHYVGFDDSSSPRRDCARSLFLRWPAAGGSP